MKKEKVILDFLRLPIAQKSEFGRSVSENMKNNPKFMNPDVTIAALDEKTELLAQRSIAALTGGKESTILMHQAEEDWDAAMRKMAKYVDRIADGDGAVIVNAGFSLAKQTTPGARPEFSIELGEKSGTVLLRRQAVEGAKSYIWQYCIGNTPSDVESEWTTALVTSKASAELSGLIPLSKYWFRSAAVLANGTSGYNSPVMQIVL